jgi:nitrite reductase (NO-forming)/hydroxylamine reductase
MEAVAAAVTKGGCGACHVMPGVPNAMGVVGPDMTSIGSEAATRVPGQTAEEYIHESIVNPNAHTAPKCPFGACVAGTMPANIEQLLSPEEIDTIVQYLLTQQGGS